MFYWPSLLSFSILFSFLSMHDTCAHLCMCNSYGQERGNLLSLCVLLFVVVLPASSACDVHRFCVTQGRGRKKRELLCPCYDSCPLSHSYGAVKKKKNPHAITYPESLFTGLLSFWLGQVLSVTSLVPGLRNWPLDLIIGREKERIFYDKPHVVLVG